MLYSTKKNARQRCLVLKESAFFWTNQWPIRFIPERINHLNESVEGLTRSLNLSPSTGSYSFIFNILFHIVYAVVTAM